MSRRNTPVATFGTGKYGHPVQQEMRHLAKTILILGTTRTGKTRLANSLARQQSIELGSGQIIINNKPDPAFVAEKARDAERLGKDFLHFSMASKGPHFQQLHPYEPPAPCHYDPLERGSGAVRARMLIDSVVHSDTSDVYRRTAMEMAGLAWDLARLTGFDYATVRGPNGQPVRTKKRSMQVLLEMLDMETFARVAGWLNVDMVRNHHPHMHPDDAQTMVEQFQSRARTIAEDAKNKSSIMSSAVADTRSITASFINSSAFFPQSLSPGAAPGMRIDLLRAIVRGEIVLFDLSAADYHQEATMLNAMILLDLQNTVSTLREYTSHMARTAADQTPWPPVILQLEELGSAADAASAEALIGLLNKSADVGIRPIISSQSLADIRKIGDVYLQRIVGLLNDLITLQMGADPDDRDFCDFSGAVTKQVPRESVEVKNNRLNLFIGAKKAKSVMTDAKELPRVPYGSTKNLSSQDDGDIREMLWITKSPKLTAVHTCGPEGPNNWAEVIQMVPVDGPELGYKPFADPAAAARSAEAAKQATIERLRARYDSPLFQDLEKLNTARLEGAASVGDVLSDAEYFEAPPDPETAHEGAADSPWGSEPVPPFDDEPPLSEPPPDANPFAQSTSPFGSGDDSDSGLPRF
ncbi:hypothetical protein [Gordonia sihwensis]|uniref:hypothetical protein n=1 Tax=Gordonia sihwensis TaxID=173559 RepID=UPI0005EF3F19|nr:hypothetical protein [Gordonia sihwensis]KJR10235.1 hypothetical protein UG54_01255 [Gordonia sihwensis]